MWYEIFKFELKYRVKRPETYVFFVFLFLFSIVGVDFVFQGLDTDFMKKDAPLVIAKTMGAITAIFMVMTSMIMGVPVIRDFKYNMESLLFVNPITKRDYLLGRFLGSFIVLLFIFSGVLFGMMLGSQMPWHEEHEMLAFNAIKYIQPFFVIVLPILFFGSCLFFVTGMLSKKLLVVYTQGVVLFVVFLLTKAITNEYWQAIFDPFSLTTLTQVAKDWTIVDRNSIGIVLKGVLLHNKLFWSLLGVVVFAIGYRKFSFNLLVKSSKRDAKKRVTPVEVDSNANYHIPKVSKHYNFKAQCIQLFELSKFYTKSLLKETSFWGIVICGAVIILINSVNLGTVYGVDSYPATYFIVEELQEMSLYFFMIILVFYSGELIWKERSAELDLIYDATSVNDSIALASKFIALIGIFIVLMLSLIVTGMLFQVANGYYHFELQLYFSGFFLEILPFLILYTFIAFFFQVVSNNKFVGILLVLLFFIVNMGSEFFGFQHSLYKFGGKPLGTYSDMNGYGHFLKPYLWIKLYWLVFGVILLTISSLISVRGTETKLKKRFRAAKYRITKPLVFFGITATVLFTLIGSYVFYNTNIINKYWTDSEETAFRVDYEKTLKKFEYLPQPKIAAVNLKLELYPSTRDYIAEGIYVLKNTYDTTIEEIHIQKLMESNVKLESVTFEGGATIDNQYVKFGYYNYKLKQPLQAGDSIIMNFKQSFTTRGFEESDSNTNIVHNGTFFNNKDFPVIGYNRKYELSDEDERTDYNLAARSNKANREDPKELVNARSGSNSDGIRFEIVIGTDKDQTAIAPGNLLKQWEENKRSYFHYKMDISMIHFYSIVSAQYEVKKETWVTVSDTMAQPVALEIYYHKDHNYNLDRMMASMKASLAYYSTNFSPYQYQQIRIMEFPRYAEYAQSFPGTVPFSEAIGFVLDIDNQEDVDMAFYVTAHELAHQWFGMQVEAANVQGRLMILETLSQYAALMVLKQEYSEEKVQQFLELQKEKYLEGRRREVAQEPSLALVENQEYIYYAKGAITMYALQESIGEDKVNLALRAFIGDWNTIDGKLKITTDRYATTKDLMGYFREVTPVSLQHIITNMFEKVIPPKSLE